MEKSEFHRQIWEGFQFRIFNLGQADEKNLMIQERYLGNNRILFYVTSFCSLQHKRKGNKLPPRIKHRTL